MYLNLWQMDHLRDDPTVRFREENVGGVDVVIVSYMVSNDELWHKDFGRETRGATFEKESGFLVSLPFDKFFNVNEKEWTQESVVSTYPIISVMEKRDGSMITAMAHDGKVFLKTKKTFFSDVAVEAQKNAPPELLGWCEALLEEFFSPIFEYTSPDTQIVIDYGEEPAFVLLAVRDMFTGRYLTQDEIQNRFPPAPVPMVPTMDGVTTVGELLELAKTTEGIEGWVVHTPAGLFKIKTQWYIDRHRMIDIRERDIANFVLDDKLDDLIPSLLAANANMEAVREIENQVTADLSRLMNKVQVLAAAARDFAEGKDRAEWINDNAGELAKFVHRHCRGLENSDESFREFYRQRYIQTFSLRSIGNPNFRGDDES